MGLILSPGATADAGTWLPLIAIIVFDTVLVRSLWRWARTKPLAPGAGAPTGSDSGQASECYCTTAEQLGTHESRADIG
jgi:hypothetical protein